MKTPQELLPVFCDWQQGDPGHRAIALVAVSMDPNAQGEREWTVEEVAAGDSDLLAAALLFGLERGNGILGQALELAFKASALRGPRPDNNPDKKNDNNPDKTPNA